MKKLYGIILLNACILLWCTNNHAMYSSSRPRPAGQFARKKLEKIQNQNLIIIRSSLSAKPQDITFVDKNVAAMSDTLTSIMEGLGSSSKEPIVFELFLATRLNLFSPSYSSIMNIRIVPTMLLSITQCNEQ